LTGLFDEARYTAALERLDITVLPLSLVRKRNEKLRIDSGYVSKESLRIDNSVRHYKGGVVDLGSLCNGFVKGIFDINASSYVEDGVPFVRIINLKDTLVDESTLAFIPEDIHESESKTALQRGDFVISKTAYPAASVITLRRCNTSQDIIAARLKPGASLNVETIVSFLNCCYGTGLMWRQFQGNVQMHLSLDDGRKIPIPCFGIGLQKAVASSVLKAERAFENSKAAMNEAEMMMLEALDFGVPHSNPKTYVRSFADVFAVERLDAEYFSPAKYATLDLLNRGVAQPLGFHYASVRQMFDPSRAVEEFVRNFDVTDALRPMLNDTKEPSLAEEIGSVKKIMRDGDVVISRLRSYLKEIALVKTTSQIPMVGSSEFIVLRKTKDCTIDSQVVLVFLRSLAVQTILKYSQDGSNHPRFAEEVLLSIPMPACLSSVTFGKSLGHLVNRSLSELEAGTVLLAASKRAVEIAVEESDEKAISYLEECERAST